MSKPGWAPPRPRRTGRPPACWPRSPPGRRAGPVRRVRRTPRGRRPVPGHLRRPAGRGGRPAPVRLARGTAGPRFFCFPSFASRSGAHQYARLAAAFDGRHELWALPAPGFAAGERLPADLDALVRLHAEDVERLAADEPFVLLGHSAGGWIAHAVATYLEKLGTAPVSVVLLDSYRPGSAILPRIQAEIAKLLTGGQLPADQLLDDTCLTAMGGYARLFESWQPQPSPRRRSSSARPGRSPASPPRAGRPPGRCRTPRTRCRATTSP
ncbi:alpha/beta fold hydrolase [Kitasatospora aburaviensis]